jgi:para-aminobenzoate synthetase
VSRDPAATFADLARRHDRMFWLDGGGSRAWSGRRSILGFLDDDDVSLTYDAAAREVTRHRAGRADVVGDDLFAVLSAEVARDAGDASVSWVGYLGYACRPDLPAAVAPGGPPDAVWMRVRDPLVVEHEPLPGGGAPGGETPGWEALPGQGAEGGSEARTGEPGAGLGPGHGGRATKERAGVPAPGFPGSARRPGTPAPAPPAYAAAFEEVQRQLRLGNSYEVNLTYREVVESALDPVDAYLRLRSINPAPYAGYLQHRGTALLSSSPERYATIDRGRWIETKPIKGTTPRGATPGQDAELARRLATDPKYRAENLMIVDLLRNDLSMVCDPGTVTVPVLMEVESYPSVHQLVSTVRGRLRDGVGTVEALRALFPAGSMTGAPKLRTMQVIEAVEASPRGVYSGAFGWISGDGRADLGVVIRSLVAETTGPAGPDGTSYRYTLGTGGAITVRSELAEEYDETRWKAARLRSALDG